MENGTNEAKTYVLSVLASLVGLSVAQNGFHAEGLSKNEGEGQDRIGRGGALPETFASSESFITVAYFYA